MIAATQIRRGMVLKVDNELYSVMTVQHITPGNWRGMVQTKMRNLRSGKQTERRFRSEESVERISLDTHELEYLYNEGPDYHFMDTADYEQITFELPSTVDLLVTETEPSVRSATVTNVTKAAKLETGLVVQVPQFVNNGERIRIDTTEGKYLQRA
jgi:elongation factor P